MGNSVKHVFIIGSKGIPASYGGFETFVEKLTEYRINPSIKYHVACLATDNNEFEHNGAHCFNVNVPTWLRSSRAVIYDILAIKYCVNYIKKNNITNAIVYVLACRIGPFIGKYRKLLDKMGCHLWVNPDGHEWLRSKWPYYVRKYWKFSEHLMVKHAELLVCDSKNIEKYIKLAYARHNPNTTFIAYGAETSKSKLEDNSKEFTDWLSANKVNPKNYYLVVGRFVSENNFETMIREFMKSKTTKDFVLVTNVNGPFFEELQQRTGFKSDSRIKFVGTVYDQELLKKIREQAYAYFHGHEVGGTNPSLLEALSSTDLNMLLGVGFNKEVAEDSALYWTKNSGSLATLIDQNDNMPESEIARYAAASTQRVKEAYSWESVVNEYEKMF